MKFHQLLHQRDAVLRTARLANVAYAYHELGLFLARVARGQLRGEVTLQLADPEAETPCPLLLANEGSQSAIDEHFLDHDIAGLADLFVFLHGRDGATQYTFRLEDIEALFREPLRQELEAGGITGLSLEDAASDSIEPRSEGARKKP